MDQFWCPVCDRAIEPKRITIATSSSTMLDAQPISRTGLHGLVHGTGRVKPGGQLKPVERAPAARRENDGTSPSPPPVPPPSPTVRTVRPRVKTVISDEPASLYCSDVCREEDANRVAECLSPVSAVSSSRYSSSPSELDYLSGSESGASSSRHVRTGSATPSSKRPPHLPRLKGFTPVRPASPPLQPRLDAMPYATMEAHREFERAVAQRRPRPPPRSPAALEEEPFESRMPPGWRPHEQAQWRKVLYGDFSAPVDRPSYIPQRQNSTPTSPTAAAASRSRSSTELADQTSIARHHRNSLPALSDMYDRLGYNSALSKRRQSREQHVSMTLLERTASSSTVSSTVSSLSSRSGSTGSVRDTTPASTAESDSDYFDNSRGFTLTGQYRPYPSLSRIGSTGSIADDAPPPPTARLDALSEMVLRDRERRRQTDLYMVKVEAEQQRLAYAEHKSSRLGRRAASSNDVGAEYDINATYRPPPALRGANARRPLFTFASARA